MDQSQCLIILLFLFFINRYELEYDENRLDIGRDIGRRFLGIDFDGQLLSDSIGRVGGRGVLNSGDGTVAINENEKINLNNANDTGNGNGITGNGGSGASGNDTTNMNNDANTNSTIKNQTDENKEKTSKGVDLICEKDELVLDVLNDDLIAKVRGRMTGTYDNFKYFNILWKRTRKVKENE